jgi:hypothetical protein
VAQRRGGGERTSAEAPFPRLWTKLPAPSSVPGFPTARLGSVCHHLATTAAVLRAEGVGRVETAEVCTACETRRSFSFRRDGVMGRHLALAVRRTT